LMRLCVFPRGRTYFAPADRLASRVADLVLSDTETRHRMSRQIYASADGSNPLGALQQALELTANAEILEKRLRVEGVKTGRITALDLPGQIDQGLREGLLNAEEARFLADYDRRVMDLVNVDDFAAHELGVAS